MAAFTLAFMGGKSIYEILHELPSALLALQWSHVDYPVGVFWTLGIEIQFYLIAPLLVWLAPEHGRNWLFMAGAFWVSLWLIFGSIADDRTMLGNLQHFVIGMIVARAYVDGMLDRLLSRPRIIGTFLCVGILTIIVINFVYHHGDFWSREAALLVDVSIAALLLAHCATERLQIPAGAAARASMIVGILAYGIYAWHGLLLTYFPELGGLFLLTYLLSLALAFVSFVFVESRLIRLGRRMSERVTSKAVRLYD